MLHRSITFFAYVALSKFLQNYFDTFLNLTHNAAIPCCGKHALLCAWYMILGQIEVEISGEWNSPFQLGAVICYLPKCSQTQGRVYVMPLSLTGLYTRCLGLRNTGQGAL